MAADPAILKRIQRIRGCPFARGGRVLVRFRANGDCLFARRSGEPLVRLRLTGEGAPIHTSWNFGRPMGERSQGINA